MEPVRLLLKNLEDSIIQIGYVGENNHIQVQIDCAEVFEKYPEAIVSMAVSSPLGQTYPAIIENEGDDVLWTVTSSDVSCEGDGKIQLTFINGEEIIKTATGKTRIKNSIVGNGPAPDPIVDFVTRADTVLAGIPDSIDSALEEAKESGEFKGDPGQDGAPGADGISPTVTVTDITGGHRVVVTDAEGPHSFDVMDGQGGGGSITVDDELSDTSTNPVQNKVITEEVTSLKEAIENLPEEKNTTEDEADLDIADENGNVIVRLVGGGIESKNFRGFKYITFSKSGTTSNQSIIITINRNFKKGDRIVLHCDRGVYPYNAPWNQGIAVTYYEDNRVIVENSRVDIAYFEHIITEDTSSVSVEYDGTLSSGSQTVTFSVSLMGDIPVTPTVLTVKKDGTGNYDNLRDAVDAIGLLANDVLNPYVIKVYPGTYDVLSDYTDEEINTSVSSYSDITFVGLKLLNGVSIVGVGDPNDIILTASLDTTNYTANVRGGISTLNKQGSGSIENVTIVSNNLRYCFHDDFGSQSGKRIKRTIKNCIFRAYNSAYTPNTSYGAGMPVGGMDAEYIDCDFGENGGLHFNTQMLHAVSVRLLNCKGLGFRIGDNTTTTGYTEISEFKFDNCDFKWIGCVVADSTPHVCIRGTGNAPMMIIAPDNVLYDLDNVVTVPLTRLNADVGDVVEWYAVNAHGPRYQAVTSLDKASGIVVFKDSENAYIQTSGYVKTSRAGISTFNLNDYVGLSSGSAVVVQNESDSFGRIKYVDDSGDGYIELRWR